MNRFFRSLLYIVTISAVMLMSIMGPTTVYADGGTSNDPVVTEPPDETTDETSAENSEVYPPPEETTEGQSSDQTPPVEAVPVEDPVEVLEILEQVPDGTDLVVVNDEGELEPLASEEAAKILVDGDPIWCPEGQVPVASTNGCTPSYTTFGDLVTELDNNATTYTGNGVIWVAASYNGNDDSAIIFDGAPGILDNLGDISVLGGWSGISGSTSIDPNTPSTLDEHLHFINWNGSISISNLDITNAPGNYSIYIRTDGDITLNNLSVSGSENAAGANVDNCQTDPCTGSGDIVVVNSEFNNNPVNGTTIRSAGEVTIENVTADNNGRDGINVQAEADVSLKEITTTNNTQDGIQVTDVGGNLTLKEVDSSNNGANGVFIEDVLGDVTGSKITSNENTLDGISISTTRGNVSLSSSTANDSTSGDGVQIHNTDGNVKLNDVTTNNNNQNGIEIFNVDGSLGLKCVQTSENDGDGIFIQVDHDFYLKCSQSTDNGSDGVEIVDAPTAQLLSFTAAGNTGLDINYDSNFTTVTTKTVDCNPDKESSPPKGNIKEKRPFTKLYCLPGEIKVALYDTYGDKIEFKNLCGYEAGVFDPSSWTYPETIPGAGNDYITSLQNKMLDEIPNLVLNTEFGLAGILAQILDELPFMLPDGFSYASAFFTAVLDEGEYLDPLPEDSDLTVRFRVPGWLDPGEELTILWWDGLDWVDLGGEYSEDGYYFQVTTAETGVFVLAVQKNDS